MQSNRHRATHSAVIAAILFAVSLPLSAKQPVLRFEQKAVVARVTPGASTVWLAVYHGSDGQRLRIVELSVLMNDDDRDGEIRHSIEGVQQSVWIVVDLESGQYDIASPDPARLRRRPFPSGAWHSQNGKAPAELRERMNSALVWLVRPLAGAWIAVVDDSSATDADMKLDGHVRLLLPSMKAIGNAPPAPSDFQRDDVLIMVNPDTLDVLDVRISK